MNDSTHISDLNNLLQKEIMDATKRTYAMCGMEFEQQSDPNKPWTREILYKKYGQYDNHFVQLELKRDSVSYSKYGECLYGSLKYTCEEQTELQAAIEMDNMPESFGKVKFELSSINPKLDDELITELDREGLPISDIYAIVSVPINLRNAFAITGKKQIPNVLTIETEMTAKEGLNFQLVLYGKMIGQGLKMQMWEKVELIALIKYLEPEILSGQLEDLSKEPRLQAAIRHKYLQYKKEVEGLSENESNEYFCLQLARCKKRYKLLEKEMQKSGVKIQDLPDDLKGIYFNFLMTFECQHVRTYPPVVWIDFERALHIVVRHMLGMQASGKFESKTPIRYDYSELIQLMRIVVDKVADQIEYEFRVYPDKSFVRKNSRAIEYNGNYYRIDIQCNGRIVTFHPYN